LNQTRGEGGGKAGRIHFLAEKARKKGAGKKTRLLIRSPEKKKKSLSQGGLKGAKRNIEHGAGERNYASDYGESQHRTTSIGLRSPSQTLQETARAKMYSGGPKSRVPSRWRQRPRRRTPGFRRKSELKPRGKKTSFVHAETSSLKKNFAKQEGDTKTRSEARRGSMIALV